MHGLKSNQDIISDQSTMHKKTLWVSLIMDGKILLSLLAIALNVNLKTTLYKLIGWKSITLLGSLFFGTNTIWVWLKLGGEIQRLRKSSN